MSRLIWTPEASAALVRAYHFLAQRDKALARRAVTKIRVETTKLISAPGLGRPVAGGPPSRRELVIAFGRSGYLVQYETGAQEIIIVGLRHQRELGL